MKTFGGLVCGLFIALYLLGSPVWAEEEAVLAAQVLRGGAQSYHTTRSEWLPAEIRFVFQEVKYEVRLEVDPKAYNADTAEAETLSRRRNEQGGNIGEVIQFALHKAKPVAPLAIALRDAAPANDTATLAAFLLTFVHALPYKSDALTSPFDDFWRSPLQTVVDREIDCEDSSILYASLLTDLGIASALILVPGHMLTAVKGPFHGTSVDNHGQRYFVAETTGTGWKVGQLPPSHANAQMAVFPMESSAVTDTTPVRTTPVIDPTPRSAPSDAGTAPRARSHQGAGAVWLAFLALFGFVGVATMVWWVVSASQRHGIRHGGESDDRGQSYEHSHYNDSDDPWKDYR